MDFAISIKMGKKRSQIEDLPAFDELYRMYEELLRLRRELESEEAEKRNDTGRAGVSARGASQEGKPT